MKQPTASQIITSLFHLERKRVLLFIFLWNVAPCFCRRRRGLDVSNPSLCLCLSHLGTERHELTSWMSFNSIFRFFNEVLELKEDEKAEGPFSAVTTRSGSLKPNHQNL